MIDEDVCLYHCSAIFLGKTHTHTYTGVESSRHHPGCAEAHFRHPGLGISEVTLSLLRGGLGRGESARVNGRSVLSVPPIKSNLSYGMMFLVGRGGDYNCPAFSFPEEFPLSTILVKWGISFSFKKRWLWCILFTPSAINALQAESYWYPHRPPKWKGKTEAEEVLSSVCHSILQNLGIDRIGKEQVIFCNNVFPCSKVFG